jgi:uncharacterized protein YaiL (DUF2058 family)
MECHDAAVKGCKTGFLQKGESRGPSVELSRTIGWMAIVLAVILAAGYAQGEAGQPAAPNKTVTVQEQVQAREAQRRAAVEEHRRRKEAYERACSKPIKSKAELDSCRAAYKRLEIDKL